MPLARSQASSDGSSGVAIVAKAFPRVGTVMNTGNVRPASRMAMPMSLVIFVEKLSHGFALCVEVIGGNLRHDGSSVVRRYLCLPLD